LLVISITCNFFSQTGTAVRKLIQENPNSRRHDGGCFEIVSLSLAKDRPFTVLSTTLSWNHTETTYFWKNL